MKRAVVTVLGTDRVGIIAGVTSTLSSFEINVLDITQTIMQDSVFVMSALVDLERCNATFHEVKERLNELGESLGVSIRIQREEVFLSLIHI